MKPLLLGAVIAAAGFLPAMGHAQWSGHLGVVSLYKSRGIDQDWRDEDVRPALQGSIRYDWSNGLYVGNWNSTGRFGSADLEIDLYAGYTGKWSNDLGYDLGYVHYIYPGEGSWNSGEWYAGLSYGNASLYAYRGTRKHVNKDDMYYVFAYKHPLTSKLSATTGLGYLDFGASGVRSKTDYSLGLEYALQEKLILSLQVQAANHKRTADGVRDTRVILGLRTDF